MAPPISFKGYALTYIALRAPIVVEMTVLAIDAFVMAPLSTASSGTYMPPPTLGPKAVSAVAITVATLTSAYVGASAFLAWRGRLSGLFMGCFDLSLLFYGLGYLAMTAGRQGWPKPLAAEAFDRFWFFILLAPQPVILALALWSINRLISSLTRGWEQER